MRAFNHFVTINTLFVKACWEVYSKPLDWFIEQTVNAGWKATEIYLKSRPESCEEILRLHRQSGLQLIAQISSTGSTPEEHLVSLQNNYLHALAHEPIAIVSHTGRDIFTFEQNRMLFEGALELSLREGVPMFHETHRGRALFAVPLCRAYLEALPELRLTADFAHLFCVHESDLSDQAEAVDAIIAATDHVHARVGFHEGPQLSDPRNPAYRNWVDHCIGLWTRIRQRMAAEGRETMTITPEFGPARLRSGRSDIPQPDCRPMGMQPLDARRTPPLLEHLISESGGTLPQNAPRHRYRVLKCRRGNHKDSSCHHVFSRHHKYQAVHFAMLAIFGSLLTIALGLLGALWPHRAASLIGISPLGGLGLSELRATYGGLFLAMGGSCLYLQSPHAYFVAGAAWSGAAALRLPSLIWDKGSFPKAIWGAAIELGIGLLLFTGVA